MRTIISNKTPRQEEAWQLRHSRNWTMQRIGKKLGIRKAAVSRLLGRAAMCEGLFLCPRYRRAKCRRVRPLSLSYINV